MNARNPQFDGLVGPTHHAGLSQAKPVTVSGLLNRDRAAARSTEMSSCRRGIPAGSRMHESVVWCCASFSGSDEQGTGKGCPPVTAALAFQRRLASPMWVHAVDGSAIHRYGWQSASHVNRIISPPFAGACLSIIAVKSDF